MGHDQTISQHVRHHRTIQEPDPCLAIFLYTCLLADISISSLMASTVSATSFTLTWVPPPPPPTPPPGSSLQMNYTIVVTRDNGSTEGTFVTMATSLTVQLSQQSCGLYLIDVAAMCARMKLGPISSLNITSGMYTCVP